MDTMEHNGRLQKGTFLSEHLLKSCIQKLECHEFGKASRELSEFCCAA